MDRGASRSRAAIGVIQITARKYTICYCSNGNYSKTMALRRNIALLMFVAILFGTAVPAFACLSEGVMSAGHDCCAVMQSCGATMTSSCCELAPRNSAPEVVSEYSL